jgi:beta-galactosidase
VFFTTPAVDETSAQIRVANTLVNETGTDVSAMVRNTLRDADARVVAVLEDACVIPAGGSTCVEQSGGVAAPHLWRTTDPHLYTLSTELVVNGIVMDSEESRVGIRDIRFDPGEGFFLNGENLKLKGVCVHHDAGCLGAAAHPKVWRAATPSA